MKYNSDREFAYHNYILILRSRFCSKMAQNTEKDETNFYQKCKAYGVWGS